MEGLTTMLVKYLEDFARPHVQEKVTEEIDETKVDLKRDLPETIMSYITGEEANQIVAQIVSNMGEDFIEKVRSVTNATVDMASEGMDLLLTNGVMNIAKGVITRDADEEGNGGFDLDFLKSGKEGMVATTMAASSPVIKQVRDNMGRKISSHFPAAIGGAIQEVIDEHGGDNGPLGFAAGLMAKFMGGDDDEPVAQAVGGGGDSRDISATGGHEGKIQRLLQKILAPKILLMIQPYLQKFEEKMTMSLEDELRNKVFSIDYIKQTVMSMLTGGDGNGGSGGSGFGNLLGAFMKGKSDDNGGSGGGGQSDALGAIGNLASQFFKH
ncbi:hypothetical protein BGZ51_005743 [Haplosporangium sp. Z 767]|nr:hypothetical protein BGZ50_004774 [Haplosporangium sp. Z 11]KAF9192350.1 hypothetical protein BGZ51_005743 [Haplosporangium sp. Z 767]